MQHLLRGADVVHRRVGGRDAVVEEREAHAVAHLGEHADLAGVLLDEGRVEQLGHRGDLLVDQRGVVADAGDARLPRHAVRVVRVVARVLVLVVGVGDEVRDVALDVDLLEVAEADEVAEHPVGRDDDVVAGVLARRERWLDDAEERLVVLDVLGVGDVDPGLFLELLERRRGAVVVLVDVERPVREVQDPCRVTAAHRAAARAGAGPRARARRACRVDAAGRQDRGQAERRCGVDGAATGAPQERAVRE
jgi:hypothetical protein